MKKIIAFLIISTNLAAMQKNQIELQQRKNSAESILLEEKTLFSKKMYDFFRQLAAQKKRQGRGHITYLVTEKQPAHLCTIEHFEYQPYELVTNKTFEPDIENNSGYTIKEKTGLFKTEIALGLNFGICIDGKWHLKYTAAQRGNRDILELIPA